MFDLPVIAHEEDRDLAGGGVMNEGADRRSASGCAGIPAAAEEVMVARDIALAELTGGRLHVAHVSTAGAVDADPRRRGAAASAVTRRGDAAPPLPHRRGGRATTTPTPR